MGEKLIGCTGFILNHEIWAKCPVCGYEYDRRKWERKGAEIRAARAAASEQANDQQGGEY